MKHPIMLSRRGTRRLRQAIGSVLTSVAIAALTASYALADPDPTPQPTLDLNSKQAPADVINVGNGIIGTLSIIGIIIGLIGMTFGIQKWRTGKDGGKAETAGAVALLVISAQFANTVGLFQGIGGFFAAFGHHA